MNKNSKTRNRIPKSCSVCRVRKTKCDKQIPSCGACIRNGTEDHCQYQAQQWMNNQDTSDFTLGLETVHAKDEEIKVLKKMISNLQSVLKSTRDSALGSDTYHHDTFVTSNDNCSLDETRFPIINSSLMVSKAEYFNSHVFAIKNLRLCQFAATSYVYYAVLDPSLNQVLGHYNANQVSIFNQNMVSLEVQKKITSNQSISSLENSSSNKVIPSAANFPILPPTDLIYKLIERFFKFCYVLAPFIYEEPFVEEVNEILVSSEYQNRSFLSHKSSVFAILLLILRISYLTIPIKSLKKLCENQHASPYEQSTDDDFSLIKVLENYPSSSFVPYAKSLLLNSSSLDWADFRKIQAFLLLKTYDLYCPEDNDRIQNTNYLMTLTAQFARFMGLNHDPENSHALGDLINLSTSDIHLWRKAWAFMCHIDAISAFASGTVCQIQEEEQCQVLPPFEELNSDGLWMMINGSEYMLKRSFEIRSLITSLLRKSMKLINTSNSRYFKKSPSSINSEVISIRSSFEEILANKLNSWIEMIKYDIRVSHGYSFIIEEIILRIQVIHYVFVLGYYLYLKTPSKNVAQKQYWFVRTTEVALIIFKFGYEFAMDSTGIVSEEYEIIVAPQIWASVTFVCLFLVSMLNTALNKTQESLKSYIIPTLARIDLMSFESMEGQQAYEWLICEKNDSISHEANLLLKLNDLYTKISKFAVRYYSVYHLCITLKLVLNYFRENYPGTFSVEDFNPFPTPESESADEILNNFENNLSFDKFLLSFDLNSDPFMNIY